MNGLGPTAMLVLLSFAMAGCSKPESVQTFQSPTKGLFLTVETYSGGGGALASDVTKVYAYFERDGKSARAPVLEGDSLTIRKIIWSAPTDATVCLASGFTDIFHNHVTLSLGDSPANSATIHFNLDEHCR